MTLIEEGKTQGLFILILRQVSLSEKENFHHESRSTREPCLVFFQGPHISLSNYADHDFIMAETMKTLFNS